MKTVIIRNETPADYPAVEHLTREAFWNQYVPGCSEHYLVHVMRSHPDYIPQLAFVLELEGRIIGSIHYTRAALIDQTGEEKPVLTFGPVSILPQFQRKGYGKRLMEHTFARAAAMGYEAIVIFGNPDNYVARGFRPAKNTMWAWRRRSSPLPCWSRSWSPARWTAGPGSIGKALLARCARMLGQWTPLTPLSRPKKRAGSPVRKPFTSTATR